MPAWLEGRPFAITVAILFGIVLLRAQATYWAGRGMSASARKTKFGRRLDGPRMTKTIDQLSRWGWPIITLSFLTIGFQTLVNAAAGVTRIHWGRYTAAMVLGCVAWAFLYATAGFTALTAWTRLEGPWQWVAFGVLVLLAFGGIAMWIHVRRMRRRNASLVSASVNPEESTATAR